VWDEMVLSGIGRKAQAGADVLGSSWILGKWKGLGHLMPPHP